MKNSLAGISSIVDHHAIPVLIQTFLYCNIFCHQEEVADDFPVSNSNAVDVMDMLFGNDQRMGRRLGVEIFERERELVLVNDLCGDFFIDDLAEDAVWITAHLVLLRSFAEIEITIRSFKGNHNVVVS